MTDTPTGAALTALSPDDAKLDALLARPTTVADALERCTRIDAMSEWLGAIRTAIREGYLTPMADEQEATTGGRFSVPVNGLGQVYRTDPQPKPLVTDAEAFARWYLADVCGEDPDRDPGEALVRFDAEVIRRTVATAESDDLLVFLNDHAEAAHGDDPKAMGQAALTLADRISVDEEYVIPAGLLDDLLAAKAHPNESGTARVKLVELEDGHTVVDTATGADVPGVTVQAPGKAQLTVKPDTAAKKRVRAELDELLGRPALRD